MKSMIIYCSGLAVVIGVALLIDPASKVQIWLGVGVLVGTAVMAGYIIAKGRK